MAVSLGVDALGFVFYPPSPRYISPERAAGIVASLPPFVAAVGLFVNAQAAVIRNILSQVQLSTLQFHGDEPPRFCEQWGKPYIKVIHVAEGIDVPSRMAPYATSAGILLDNHTPASPGGTGQVFDWTLVPTMTRPVILAGGLDADNLAEAVRKIRPYAVDVSSSLEKEPGMKDIKKTFEFMKILQKINNSN